MRGVPTTRGARRHGQERRYAERGTGYVEREGAAQASARMPRKSNFHIVRVIDRYCASFESRLQFLCIQTARVSCVPVNRYTGRLHCNSLQHCAISYAEKEVPRQYPITDEFCVNPGLLASCRVLDLLLQCCHNRYSQ